MCYKIAFPFQNRLKLNKSFKEEANLFVKRFFYEETIIKPLFQKNIVFKYIYLVFLKDFCKTSIEYLYNVYL